MSTSSFISPERQSHPNLLVLISVFHRMTVYFKKRLWKEGLNERKTQLGIKSAAPTVGYYQQCDGVKDKNSFTESFTNDQWTIGLHKVLTHGEFVITTRNMESTVVHSVPMAHQRSISCHLTTEALVSQERTERRKFASNDQQTSTQLHVTEEDQDNVSEETVVVPSEEYSLESFNLLQGNEIQIHDESVINDVNVTNQDVPAQNVRPLKRLKISDTDEAQPLVQSPQETVAF